jgi:peroxidase
LQGLDGSVLLTKTPFNTTIGPASTFTGPTEQGSPSNGGLRGLEVIEEIRTKLAEKNITKNCSCADAVVFAAREAAYVLSKGAIKYAIEGTGRKDGVVSKADEPGKFLPGPTYSFGELVTNFSAKGFNWKELVVLSGAHCIGVSHLPAVADRFLPNATTQIDPQYKVAILAETENATSPEFENNIRDMTKVRDSVGYKANKVDLNAVGVLDNSYYNANLQNMVPFTSDWTLRTDTGAEGLMETYRDKAAEWNQAFSAAMTKLSNTLKAEGTIEKGIRKKCSETNFKTKEDYP